MAESTTTTSATLEKLKVGFSAFGAKVKSGSAAASKTLSEQMTAVGGKMKDLFVTPTEADRLVDEATDETLEGPHWGKNLALCDLVNAEKVSSSDLVKAIKRRLSVKTGKVQHLTLILLETSAKNCVKVFGEISSEKVLDDLVRLADDPIAAFEVRNKALTLIESWGEATEELRYLPVFEETYKSLKSRGVHFPGRDEESLAPIFTPPQTHPIAAPAPPTVNERIPSQFTVADPKEAIAVARNTVELLNTVLTSAPPQEALQDELVPALVSQSRQSQNIIQSIIETAGENETLLFEALSVHDELNSALAKYESLKSGQPEPKRESPPAIVPVTTNDEEEPLVGAEGGLVRNRAGAKPTGAQKKDDDDMIVF